MNRIILLIILVLTPLFLIFFRSPDIRSQEDDEFVTPSLNLNPLEAMAYAKFPDILNWERPDVPVKVALQIGHKDAASHPDELANLRNNTGAQGGGKTETEVNESIAKATQIILEARGIYVELLPATIPPGYWADVFVAIHADGSDDRSATGYKAARTYRDMTNSADLLVELLEEEYEKATGLTHDDNVTRNMRGYYAFRWWRYDHAVHPMTVAAIMETGFLTNPQDRKIIVDQPEVSGEAIARAIILFLENKELI